MQLVKYPCGCVGVPPDDTGEAFVLEPCEDPTPGPGLAPMHKSFDKLETGDAKPLSPTMAKTYEHQLIQMAKKAHSLGVIIEAVKENL